MCLCKLWCCLCIKFRFSQARSPHLVTRYTHAKMYLVYMEWMARATRLPLSDWARECYFVNYDNRLVKNRSSAASKLARKEFPVIHICSHLLMFDVTTLSVRLFQSFKSLLHRIFLLGFVRVCFLTIFFLWPLVNVLDMLLITNIVLLLILSMLLTILYVWMRSVF